MGFQGIFLHDKNPRWWQQQWETAKEMFPKEAAIETIEVWVVVVFCVVVYLRGVSTNTQKSETEGRSYGLKILLFLVGIVLMGR